MGTFGVVALIGALIAAPAVASAVEPYDTLAIQVTAGAEGATVEVSIDMIVDRPPMASDAALTAIVNRDVSWMTPSHLGTGEAVIRESDPSGHREVVLRSSGGSRSRIRSTMFEVISPGDWVDFYLAMPEKTITSAAVSVEVTSGSLESVVRSNLSGSVAIKAASHSLGVAVGPTAVADTQISVEIPHPIMGAFFGTDCLTMCIYTWREPGKTPARQGRVSTSGTLGEAHQELASCYMPCMFTPAGEAGTWDFSWEGTFEHPALEQRELGEPTVLVHFPALRFPF